MHLTSMRPNLSMAAQLLWCGLFTWCFQFDEEDSPFAKEEAVRHAAQTWRDELPHQPSALFSVEAHLKFDLTFPHSASALRHFEHSL